MISVYYIEATNEIIEAHKSGTVLYSEGREISLCFQYKGKRIISDVPLCIAETMGAVIYLGEL